MAKFTGWVGKPDGSGFAVDEQGNIQPFKQKPPESEFVSKPAGAPAGDFIRTPAGEFAEVGPGGQARTEFLGEIQDRRNEVEKAAAARLGARMGAKKKLDEQGMRLGYTPAQERSKSALRNARAKLEGQFADGRHTPEQMLQFENQIFLKEQAIMPQMIRQQPTPQETLQASIVTLPNGRVGQLDDKGLFKEIDTGSVTFKDWNNAVKNARESFQTGPALEDEKGKLREPSSEEIQQRALESITNFQTIKGLLTGADSGGQPPTGQPQLREQPAPAAAVQPTTVKPTQTDMQEVFNTGVAALGGRASASEMEQLGQQFVLQAVQSGMSVDDAVEQFMKLWRKARTKKGVLRVASPGKFDKNKLKQAASRSRLEFLRAKASQ